MKIAIATPAYRHQSAGVRSLHYLAYLCRELGHQTHVNTEYLNKDWGDYSTPFNHDDDFTYIIPEIHAPTLPQEGVSVVRWVLYYPGVLGGPKTYPDHEYVVSFHDAYKKSAEEAAGKPVDSLYLPYIPMPGLHEEVKKTSTACWYQGKGKRIRPPVLGTTEITREWPAKREELIRLLKSSRMFFTTDEHTALLQEAKLCGCLCFLYFGGSWIEWNDPALSEKIPTEEQSLQTVREFLERVRKHFSLP